MTKISIIIPLHEFNDGVKNYLTKALNSINAQIGVEQLPKVVVVYNHSAEQNGIIEYIKEFTDTTGLLISSLKNDGKTDFCGQVNFAVNQITSDYFSILEYDDEYSTIYFKNVEKNIDLLPEVGMFLPFTVEVDDKTSTLVQIVNQTIWSKGYVGENGVLGYLNIKSLNEFSFYTIGGSVIKKSEFDASGGLKTNIKLAFTYEFILRFLENGNKIYTIPKFGYRHTINRQGSLFFNYGAIMSMEERKFWFETAKKECHFFNDRLIDTSNLNQRLTEATI